MLKESNRIQDYVRKFAPSQYALIEDPETYFAEMLDELQQAQRANLNEIQGENWKPTAADLANPLAMVGRRRANYMAAAELAWSQIVLERFPAEVDEEGTPLEDGLEEGLDS